MKLATHSSVYDLALTLCVIAAYRVVSVKLVEEKKTVSLRVFTRQLLNLSGSFACVGRQAIALRGDKEVERALSTTTTTPANNNFIVERL